MKIHLPILLLAIFSPSVFAMQVTDTADQIEHEQFRQDQFEQEQIEAERKTASLIDRLLKTQSSREVESELAAITDEYDALEVGATLLLNKKHQTEAAMELVWRSRGAKTFFQDITVDFNSDVKRLIIPKLLETIQGIDPDRTRRAQAYLESLPSIPKENAIQLRSMAVHQHRYVREVACRLMSKLERVSKKDIDIMTTCLKDSSGTVCRAAVETAAEWGSPALLSAVLDHEHSDNYKIRIAVAKAILAMDSSSEYDGIALLRDVYFESDSATVRNAVARAMIEFVPDILVAPKLIQDVLNLPSDMSSGGRFSFETSLYLEAVDTLQACGQAAVPQITKWLRDEELTTRVRQRLLSVLANSDWDLSSAIPVISEQLEHADVSVRENALLALAKAGDVDAERVMQGITADSQIQRAAATALGCVNDKTRALARFALLHMAKNKDPTIRIVAIQNYLQLTGDHQAVVSDFTELIHNPTFGDLKSLDFDDQKRFIDVAQKLRPSPPDLSAALLKLISDEHAPWVVLRILAALDDTAFNAKVKLLESKNPETRAEGLEMLGTSKRPEATEILRSYLNDKTDHYVAFSDHMLGLSELRITALEALAQFSGSSDIQLPVFIDGLSEDWSRETAIRALSNFGSKAQVTLPKLLSLLDNDLIDQRQRLELSVAIAKLDPHPVKRLAGLRTQLLNIAAPRLCCQDNMYLGMDIKESLVELHDMGIDIRPLRPELVQLAMDHPCMAHTTRIWAASVLAIIEPDDPRWIQMLRNWAKMEVIYDSPAADSLKEIELRR